MAKTSEEIRKINDELLPLIEKRSLETANACAERQHWLRENIRKRQWPNAALMDQTFFALQTAVLWKLLLRNVAEEGYPPLEAIIHARAEARHHPNGFPTPVGDSALWQAAGNDSRRRAVQQFLEETAPYAFNEREK